jgi:hypothetical protein
MYNIWKGNRTLLISISVIVLISVSTPQLSSMIVANGNTAVTNNVYAQFPPGPRPPPGQQFPPVPPGQQFPPVPPGQQFPPVPPGLDEELQTRVVIGAFGQVEGDGSTSSRSAICASDEVVTGGGSEVTSGGNLINPTHRDYAEPTNNPDRWTVTVTNPGPNPIDIRAFAVCAKLVDVP